MQSQLRIHMNLLTLTLQLLHKTTIRMVRLIIGESSCLIGRLSSSSKRSCFSLLLPIARMIGTDHIFGVWLVIIFWNLLTGSGQLLLRKEDWVLNFDRIFGILLRIQSGICLLSWHNRMKSLMLEVS